MKRHHVNRIFALSVIVGVLLVVGFWIYQTQAQENEQRVVEVEIGGDDDAKGEGAISPKAVIIDDILIKGIFGVQDPTTPGVNPLNLIVLNSGVGIGTTTPLQRLHVTGRGQLDILRLSDTGGDSNFWEFTENATNDLTVTYGGEILRVTSDGNFGIGVTSPAERLQVNGAILVDNTTNTNAGAIRWTGTDFEGYDGSIWKSFTQAADGGVTSVTPGDGLVGNALLTGDVILDVGAGDGISVAGDTISATLGTSISGSELENNAVNSAKIQDGTITSADIQDNTITESDISDSFTARDADKLDGFDSTAFSRSWTDGSGNVTTQGFVGIGTTSPSSKLEIITSSQHGLLSR
ncbi:hypothetical protein IH992_30045, partial [Candidatus Poribacteria bacterium]|nr:hypothetical protein [Candidatus Poribacteria bacterium]